MRERDTEGSQRGDSTVRGANGEIFGSHDGGGCGGARITLSLSLSPSPPPLSLLLSFPSTLWNATSPEKQSSVCRLLCKGATRARAPFRLVHPREKKEEKEVVPRSKRSLCNFRRVLSLPIILLVLLPILYCCCYYYYYFREMFEDTGR